MLSHKIFQILLSLIFNQRNNSIHLDILFYLLLININNFGYLTLFDEGSGYDLHIFANNSL